SVGADERDPPLFQPQVHVGHHGRGVVGVSHVLELDHRTTVHIVATPIPPPEDNAASPVLPRPCATNRANNRTTRPAPDPPHGCPSAMAPPSGLTTLSSIPPTSIPPASVLTASVFTASVFTASRHASTCPANASVNSTASSRTPPTSLSTALIAGTAPRPRRAGAHPRVADAVSRSPGTPSRARTRSLTTTTAAAPSLTPREWAAVTVPSAVNAGRKRASRSAVNPGRGRSSADSPASGTSSSSNRPSRWAATALAWLRAAKASCRSRLIPASAATTSAAGPMSGSPNSAGANGARGYGVGGSVGHARCGAVEALSTPPASTTSASPAQIWAAAWVIAASPLAHCRSTVTPGTSTPSPARNAATRAGLPPGPKTLPST